MVAFFLRVVSSTESVVHIHRRGGSLENAECADDGGRHAVVGLIYFEVGEGAFGLGAPIFV